MESTKNRCFKKIFFYYLLIESSPVCFAADDQDVGPAGGLPGERGLQVRED